MASLEWTLTRAEALDESDVLAAVRERFFVPEGIVYLDGNSLGALPRSVPEALKSVVERDWGVGIVRSWEEWMGLPRSVGDKIAELIGAHEGEVIALDTTTIALSKLIGAALKLRPGRSVVLTAENNFPTDLYAISAVAALFERIEVRHVAPEDIGRSIDDSVAAMCLTHVDFRTGAMLDMAGLTSSAHEAGALAIWDLCHSAGALSLNCGRDRVDMAVGCSYKYLNGGPGAPAFVYVRHELQELLQNPLPGWMGHEAPFEFASSYRPALGIGRLMTSTPPVLGLVALDAALDAFEGVSMQDVREKSIGLSEMFIEAVFERVGMEFELASPRDPAMRGSQVSLSHPRSYEIVQALIARGVIADFRPPEICRFGFAPLYLSYAEVFLAAETVALVMDGREYET